MDPFQRTGSPHYNALLEAARRAWGEQPPTRASLDELQARQEQMLAFLTGFKAECARILEVREPTPLAREVTARLGERLRSLELALFAVGEFLEAPDRETLRTALVQGREALEATFTDFRALAEEEASMPRHSRSPALNELLRVAHGVGRGQFPPGALAERLQAIRDGFARFVEDFLEVARAPGEEIAPLLPRLEDELVSLREGLDRMEEFLATGQAGMLQEGILQVGQAGEQLLGTWEALEQAQRPPEVSCLRCGAANPSGRRLCGACLAVLPATAAGGLPALLDVTVGAGGQRPVFPHVARLEEAVDAYRAGVSERAELEQTVAWFAGRVRQGQAQLAAAPAPRGEPPELHRRLEAATARLVQAVEKLEVGVALGDLEALIQGVELARSGAELIRDGLGPPSGAPG